MSKRSHVKRLEFAGSVVQRERTLLRRPLLLATVAVMDVAGLGIDLAEVPRVRRLLATYGERFKDRCFTDHEWEYAHRYVDPSARLAARFAGKEAVMKSLGAGWRRIHWKDVEITGGGAPRVNLSGTAARRAEMIGVSRVLVTITHTDHQAMVFAMSFRDGAA